MDRFFSEVAPKPGKTLAVALTGAGGKTSLLSLLADHYARLGHPVLVSTTTRMYLPNRENISPLVCDDMLLMEGRTPETAALEVEEALTTLHRTNCSPASRLFLAVTREGDKAVGLDPAWLCKVWRRVERRMMAAEGPLPILLLEADGSARKPLKAHAPHEPVIPECMDTVIAVAGMNALGQPWRDAVHRYETGLRLLGYDPLQLEGRPVKEEDVARLLSLPEGPFRDWEGKRIVFLNKAELVDRQETLAKMRGLLRKRLPGVPLFAGSVKEAWALRLEKDSWE